MSNILQHVLHTLEARKVELIERERERERVEYGSQSMCSHRQDRAPFSSLILSFPRLWKKTLLVLFSISFQSWEALRKIWGQLEQEERRERWDFFNQGMGGRESSGPLFRLLFTLSLLSLFFSLFLSRVS